MIRVLVVVALVLALVAANAGTVAAQATPAPGDTGELDFPDPADCTVEPRTEEEFRALIQEATAASTPEASPAASPEMPVGTPADEGTVTEIHATWREFIACIDAGDELAHFRPHLG